VKHTPHNLPFRLGNLDFLRRRASSRTEPAKRFGHRLRRQKLPACYVVPNFAAAPFDIPLRAFAHVLTELSRVPGVGS
jgi:hypothetical protein